MTTSTRLTVVGLILLVWLCFESSQAANNTSSGGANKTDLVVGASKAKLGQEQDDDDEASKSAEPVSTSSESPSSTHLRTKDVLPEEDDEELNPRRVELWLDEHRTFAHDYFVKKATRQMVDDWLKLHASQASSKTPTSTPAPASTSTLASASSSTSTSTTTTTTTTTPAPPRVSSTTSAPPSTVQARPDSVAMNTTSTTTTTTTTSTTPRPRLIGQQSGLLSLSTGNSTTTAATPASSNSSGNQVDSWPLGSSTASLEHLKPESVQLVAATTARPGAVSTPSVATTFAVAPITTTGATSIAPSSSLANRSDIVATSSTISGSSSAQSSSSPRPLNVSGDHIKSTTPWSSSTDLTTRDRSTQTLPTTLITVGSTASREQSSALPPAPTVPMSAATTQAPPTVSTANETRPVNVSGLSLVEMIKDMNDEHLRIEDDVKEQASSLRHFIIICSVLVVLATSLVVALLISLCK